MKRILLIIGLFLTLTPIAHAAYVQSGHLNFATAANTICAPNTGSGSATTGNLEVIVVQANSATSVTISSTRVTTWVLDQSQTAGSAHLYFWHGTVTSTGAESITVAFTSGTALIGSACAEYSSTTVLNATNGQNSAGAMTITTTAANTQLVEVSSFTVSGTGAASPYTNRQVVQSGGTTFLCLGDLTESAAGTYNDAFTGSSPVPKAISAFAIPNAVSGVPRHR